jgi:hypothetical protein
MDTFFSDTPAMDDGVPGHGGCTMLQVICGMQSGAVWGYPMKSESKLPYALEDHFRKVGAPLGIMSDNAKAEIHGKSKELLRMYNVDDHQSEPAYQHQNPAERKIQDVKRMMNSVMDRTGCPAEGWLLAALFVCAFLLLVPNSHGEIPYTMVTGQTADILKFMHFHFWQEVFVESHKENKRKELARWCYPADNVGDALTYWVLLDNTKELVPRSNVRPAKDPLFPNLRLRPHTDNLRNMPLVEMVDEAEAAESPDVSDTPGEPQTARKSPIYNIQDSFDVPVHLP